MKMYNIFPWQKKNWQHLITIKKKQPARFPQALLFWGPQGLGQENFAKELSAWLLCETPKISSFSGEESACNECASCRWLVAGTHPDRLILMPESEHASIKVDAVREIRSFSEQKSHAGKGRIIVISPVEAMNLSAANALLKILEEPFEESIFLLTSYHLSWVLPTIRSRCQKIYFPPLNAEEFKSAMLEQKCPEAMIEELYILSHGAPLAFKTLEQQKNIITARKKIESIIEAIKTKKINSMEAAEKTKLVEKEALIDFEALLNILIHCVSQNLASHMKFNNVPVSLQNQREYCFYDKLLEIKKYLKAGNNLNQMIELENLFLELR